jgi:hypothetical protein
MRRTELERVRAWAAAKIAAGEKYRSISPHCIKLLEALDAILSDREESPDTQTKSSCQRFIESARKL